MPPSGPSWPALTVLSLSLLEKAAALREKEAAQTAATAGGYTVTGEGDSEIDALVLARYEAKKAKELRRGRPNPG